MLFTVRFFPSKCSLFRKANLFGSCIIHILYTECAEIKKKKYSGARGLKSLKQGNFTLQTGLSFFPIPCPISRFPISCSVSC